MLSPCPKTNVRRSQRADDHTGLQMKISRGEDRGNCIRLDLFVRHLDGFRGRQDVVVVVIVDMG